MLTVREVAFDRLAENWIYFCIYSSIWRHDPSYSRPDRHMSHLASDRNGFRFHPANPRSSLPSKLAEMVKHVTCIWAVSCSILGLETGYPHWVFLRFSPAVQINTEKVRNVTPRLLDAIHIPVQFTTTISIEDASLRIRQNPYKKPHLNKYTWHLKFLWQIILLDVTQRSLVEQDQHVNGSCCLLRQGRNNACNKA